MARTQVSGIEIEDKSVESVDLSDGLSLAIFKTSNAGWLDVNPESSAIVELTNIAVVSKFEKQTGHVKHRGFIKGNA